MRIAYLHPTLLAAAILASCSLVIKPAAAQSTQAPQAAAQGDEIAEIVVTAQKRSERLQDVPISISAVSGDQLAAAGISRPEDLGDVVPGFSYQKSVYGTPVFAIRGVGVFDYSAGISPAVTVYVDQVPVPYLAMAQGAGFDVERVEVLKGPQGTLFGQNSTAGAINYIANKPSAEPTSGFDLTYGRFNEVDAQAFVSGPLTDTLGVRVAGKHESGDGWQISQTRPDDRLGRRDFTQGRIEVDWDPTSRFKVELTANGWADRSDTQANQFVKFVPKAPGGYADGYLIANQPTAPNNDQIADWVPNTRYQKDDDYSQIAVRADWEMSNELTLTSISAYSDFRQGNDPGDDLIPTTGTNAFNQEVAIKTRISTISQELRAALDMQNGIKIIAGGNYEDDHTFDDQATLYGNATNLGVGPDEFHSFDYFADQRVHTYAAFGSADIPLVSTLTGQIGARYTKQDRAFQGCLNDSGNGELAAAIGLIDPALPVAAPGTCVTIANIGTPTAPVLTQPGIVRNSLDQSNVSWRAGLNWKPSNDLLVYANATKGYKAGAFVPEPAVFAGQFSPVTQESVLAYEVGVKQSLFDRKVSISAATFYYDYRDKQIQGFIPLPPFGSVSSEINIPKSRVEGAEFQIDVRPMRGLQLSAASSYVSSKVTQGPPSAADALGNSINITGEAFPNAPSWQFAANARYEFSLSDSMNAFLGSNVSYRTATYAQFGNDALFKMPSYPLAGVYAGIKAPNDRWSVQLWGRNIFDRFYVSGVTYAGDAIERTTGQPGTYGATLSMRF